MRVALKIDVDTMLGTRHGVPHLAAICERHAARATFLFSLGPDRTGRAIKRVFRRGFLGKVARTSVLQHYGLRTLLFGTLLPAPDIARCCANQMRAVRDQGFEVGVHAWDHCAWQDQLRHRNDEFANRQMRLAFDRFVEIFGFAPKVHGAAGWQMTEAALLAEEALGYEFASDTRGASPFFPACADHRLKCLQLPTTLPTLDELIGREAELGASPVDHLLRLTAESPGDHVYTLHAELEGRRLSRAFEALLTGWHAQGYAFATLGDLARSHGGAGTRTGHLREGTVSGRSGLLAIDDSLLSVFQSGTSHAS